MREEEQKKPIEEDPREGITSKEMAERYKSIVMNLLSFILFTFKVSEGVQNITSMSVQAMLLFNYSDIHHWLTQWPKSLVVKKELTVKVKKTMNFAKILKNQKIDMPFRMNKLFIQL